VAQVHRWHRSNTAVMRDASAGQNPSRMKIDLLIMLDNSSSMADKQDIVALASRSGQSLVDPVCRRSDHACAGGGSATPMGPVLPAWSTSYRSRTFTSASSPLRWGGHGSTRRVRCVRHPQNVPHNDDRGHLVLAAAMDGVVPTFQNKVSSIEPRRWRGRDGSRHHGALHPMVVVWAAWLRYERRSKQFTGFSVDPTPYDTLTVAGAGLGVATLNGIDTTLIQQRMDFLRPDSLVASWRFTDENDCSIIDAGQNFYVIVPQSDSPAKSILTHGTSACRTNPNDRCCVSCLQTVPAGCPPKETDPECQIGRWLKTEDPENLRCFHQNGRVMDGPSCRSNGTSTAW